MINNIELPNQNIPFNNKLQNGYTQYDTNSQQRDKTWGEQMIDYHINLAMGMEYTRDELLMCYRLKDGVINEKDYNYILNPLNTDDPQFKRLPATLRCYNIIKPVIDEFIGERTQKPLEPVVVIGNKDADNLFKQSLIEGVNNILKQQFINMLNSMGVNTGVDSQEVPNAEEYVKMFKNDWDSQIAQEKQDIIGLITKECELDEKYQIAYEHWLTSGMVIDYTTVTNGELYHEIVHPLDAYFPKYKTTSDISDGKWFCRKFDSISMFDVIDRLQHKLSAEDTEWIENSSRIGETQLRPTSFLMSTSRDIASERNSNNNSANQQQVWENDNLTLWHCEFKTPRKVGILTTIDEIGNTISVDVSDDYVFDKTKDINIEWYYITTVFEGYRLETTNQTSYRYFSINPLVVQRTELSTNQKAKLSYGGRYRADVDGKIISEVKTGYPYQVLYNIFHFQFEKIMNKNKEKILMIPLGVIPNKPGWSMDKFMYYMDALSLGFFDETKQNALAALQGLKSIDMGLSQYAAKMVDFLSSIRQEWWDAVGTNRQRLGSTQASDGKAVNEQALFHSSLITAEMNRKFDKFIERSYQTLLDWSKIAWINGKKASYVRSDGSKAIIEINPEDHLGTDYNIFVKNSAEEYRKLQTMETMALNILQNGGAGSSIAKVLDAGNMTKITKILEEGEALQREYNKSIEDSKNQTAVKIEELKQETENTKQETQMYSSDRNYDATIDKENIITDREILLASLTSEEDNNVEKGSNLEEYKKIIEFRKQELAEKKHYDTMKDKIRNTDIKEKVANKPIAKK